MNKLSNVRRFISLLSGEGLTSFSINNRTNFFGEGKSNEPFRGVFFLEHAQNLLSLISYSFSFPNLKLFITIRCNFIIVLDNHGIDRGGTSRLVNVQDIY